MSETNGKLPARLPVLQRLADLPVGSVARLSCEELSEGEACLLAAMGMTEGCRLRALMTEALDEADSRGLPAAMLLASEAAIYQRFGFGVATRHVSFRFDPRHAELLDQVEAGVAVRLVVASETAADASAPKPE